MADAVQQGREAFERQAWAQGYEHLAAAAEQVELDAGDLQRLAVAAYLTGNDEASNRAWEEAHRRCAEEGKPDDAARHAFWLAIAYMFRGEMAQASGWLARAGRVVEEAEEECVAAGYLLIPPFLQTLDSGDADTAYDLALQTTAIGRRFGDADLTALGLLSQGQAEIGRGKLERGAALLDEAMVAVTVGEVSPIPAGIIYCAVIDSCMRAFDVRRAAEWTEALTRWCEDQPDLVPYRGQCLVHRSQVLQAHGEWPAAAEEAERARERLAEPPHPAIGIAYYQRGELARLRGEFADAKEAYREASKFGVEVAAGLSLLRLAADEGDAAATTIRRAVDENDDLLARPALLAASVEIMRAVGDIAAARVAVDELSKLAGDLKASVLLGTAAQAEGSVLLAEGEPSAALAALRRACTHWQTLEMPYETARTRVLVGLALAALGDRDTADLEFDAARSTFEELGANPDLTRLDRLLGAPADAAESPLTGREREVLRLVAAGKTNRDVAAELVISEHTVARHVQNIFTKLDISSRSAATAYAYEHDLI